MRNRLLRDIFSALESAEPVSRTDIVDEYRELSMLAGAWERGSLKVGRPRERPVGSRMRKSKESAPR